MTRAELLRTELRAGRKTGPELATATGIDNQRIVPLLKNDIAKGRVRRIPTDSHAVIYAWVDQEQLAVRDAVRFLEGRGYRVVAP